MLTTMNFINDTQSASMENLWNTLLMEIMMYAVLLKSWRSLDYV